MNNLAQMKLSSIILLFIALVMLSVALWELGKLRLILREDGTAGASLVTEVLDGQTDPYI
ncbi:hypothetical protein ACQY1H_24015 (plasmid) [Agrobacterium vitis]|uniref:hypothetical protein n=1 Tax=Agrobacterium vitis TaxID=373 RepID=UPI003D276E95